MATVNVINPIVNDNNKAANIRIILETPKEFEEIYSKSEPKCCSFTYNLLSLQVDFVIIVLYGEVGYK